jgi:hypothetical protein
LTSRSVTSLVLEEKKNGRTKNATSAAAAMVVPNAIATLTPRVKAIPVCSVGAWRPG